MEGSLTALSWKKNSETFSNGSKVLPQKIEQTWEMKKNSFEKYLWPHEIHKSEHLTNVIESRCETSLTPC